ncbi:MAG: A/G-specific adenine glycosylase [Maricaulaceae bacterium]|jgi:A/G-specific adenine glycosylase
MSASRRRRALLDWYDAHGRSLPWRVRPEDRAKGARADPYRVWLSEIMLQQTTVAAVQPYYAKFLQRFPKVEDLAAADLDEVLRLWAGLGYYARARNLHACAKVVAARGGAFPDDEAGLLALPGIGPYTAAAITAMCFDRPANVVDGNVERVMARSFAVDAPLPSAKPELAALAAPLVDPDRPGDYVQALMDLGATVCAPKSPDCPACPWRVGCAAHAAGDPTAYPKREKKAARPTRRGVAFVLMRGEHVLLRRRPEKGLLGGMAETPGTPWRAKRWSRAEALAHAPAEADWARAGAAAHVFTHFALELEVWRAVAPVRFAPADGWWASVAALEDEALPSVMRKALAVGITRAAGAS